MAVPNLVIAGSGAAGDVNFYNNAGNVHCSVDVVGYFRDGSSVGMSPLAPARLLDTRDGTVDTSAHSGRPDARSADR